MKILKILLVTTLSVLFIVVVTGLGYGIFYRENITRLVINEINSRINVPLSIESIHLSYLKQFPDIAVRLNNTNVYPEAPLNDAEQNREFITIKETYLEFNLLDFLQKEYTVKAINLHHVHAVLTPEFIRLLKKNFIKASLRENQFNIRLEKLNFSSVTVQYSEPGEHISLHMNIKNTSISGNFYENIKELILKGDLQVHHIKQQGVSYVKDRKVTVLTRILAEEEAVNIPSGVLTLSGIPFNIRGSYHKKKKEIDGILSSGQLKLKDFLKMLPEKYSGKYAKYKTSGTFQFDALVNGQLNQNPVPDITMMFSLKDGTMTEPQSQLTLNNLNLKGIFSNGAHNTASSSVIELEQYAFTIENSQLEGNLTLTDLTNPAIHYRLLADIQAREVTEFLKLKEFEVYSGNIGMNIQGSMPAGDFRTLHNYADVNGSVYIRNLSFNTYKDSLQLRNVTGKLNFKPQHIQHDIFFKMNTSDVTVSGTHLKSNLFENRKDPLSWIIQSGYVNVEDMLLLQRFIRHQFNPSFDDRSGKHNFQLSVDTLEYQELTAHDLLSDVAYYDNSFHTGTTSFHTMDGQLIASARFNNEKPLKELSVQSRINHVNISSLFASFRNFRQNTLTSDNIHGFVSGNITFRSQFENNRIIPSSMEAEGDVIINQGVLMDFKPLNKVSRFIEVSELKTISFSSLQNKLQIKNETLYIPKMDIESSALDLTVSGIHRFNSAFEYHAELLLSDILSKKAIKNKNENKKFGIIEDDKIGKMKLYLQLKGNKEKMDISYDQNALANHIRQKAAEEKNELKHSLQEEFGWYEQEDIPDTEQTPEKSFEIDWQDTKEETKRQPKEADRKVRSKGFQIEWESD